MATVIGKKVKLTRCISTSSRHWDLGTTMKVLARAEDGTYMLIRPGGEMSGPRAMFGDIHSVSRRDFKVLP
jgi:uncharacterized membrane protein